VAEADHVGLITRIWYYPSVPLRVNPASVLWRDPPFDPCALPRAMLVIERAKDVSQPDK